MHPDSLLTAERAIRAPPRSQIEGGLLKRCRDLDHERQGRDPLARLDPRQIGVAVASAFDQPALAQAELSPSLPDTPSRVPVGLHKREPSGIRGLGTYT